MLFVYVFAYIILALLTSIPIIMSGADARKNGAKVSVVAILFLTTLASLLWPLYWVARLYYRWKEVP